MKSILQTVVKPVIDTLAKHADVKEKPVNDTLEILAKVNEFYNSAWDKLLIFGTVSFAIIGIVLPVIIQWYQNRIIKINEKEFEAKINLKIEDLKKEMKTEIETEFSEKRKNLEVILEKQENLFSARIAHMQAINYLDNNNTYDALKEYIISIEFYINTDDYNNLIRSLKSILICLETIKKEDLKSLKDLDSFDLIEIIKDLNKKDKTRALLDFTDEIKTKIHEINSRS